MFNKPAAFVQINASALQLTNSLVAIPAQASAGGDGAVAGTSTGAVPLAGLALATISADYAPGAGGGSTTYPELVVELSRDPLTTAPASVGHWAAVRNFEAAGFSSGAASAYPSQVSFPPGNTTQTITWPATLDVRGWNWIRLRAMDNDSSHPGTLLAFLGGTV